MSRSMRFRNIGAVETTAPPGDNCTPWDTCAPFDFPSLLK